MCRSFGLRLRRMHRFWGEHSESVTFTLIVIPPDIVYSVTRLMISPLPLDIIPALSITQFLKVATPVEYSALPDDVLALAITTDGILSNEED